MAYIATKATYIGEEEVKDENGKPVVDDNGNPVKRITTDVDDVVFEAGEVIILVEKINDGKHFDLEIEDKGSTYFAPTQIKIGDGMHSFGELNWLQTIDDFRVESIIDKQIATYKTNIDKIYETFTNGINEKIGEQNAIISDFVNYQSKEILRDLVKENYFSRTGNGVLQALSKSNDAQNNNLKSFAVGYENIFESHSPNLYGQWCVAFGYQNRTFGYRNYSFGEQNSVNGCNTLVYGLLNSVATTDRNNWTVCLGHDNEIHTKDHNFVVGEYNRIYSNHNFIIGNNNRTNSDNSFICGVDNVTQGEYDFICGNSCYTKGNYSFACGQSTETLTNNSFACGLYNDGNNKIFSIGNGTEKKRSNAFDIDTNGKATFYKNLQCNNNLLVNNSLYSNNYIGLDKLNFLIEHNSTKKTVMTIDELGNSYIHGDLTIYGDITNEINYSHKMLNTLFKESDNNDMIYRSGFQIHTIGTPGIYTVLYFENSGTSTSNNYSIITDPILLPKNTYLFKYKTNIKDNIKIVLMNDNNVIAQIDNNSEYIDDYVELEIKIDNPKEIRMVIEPIKFNENKPDIAPSIFYLSLTNKEQNNSITDEIALLKYDIEMLKNKG